MLARVAVALCGLWGAPSGRRPGAAPRSTSDPHSSAGGGQFSATRVGARVQRVLWVLLSTISPSCDSFGCATCARRAPERGDLLGSSTRATSRRRPGSSVMAMYGRGNRQYASVAHYPPK